MSFCLDTVMSNKLQLRVRLKDADDADNADEGN